MPSRKLLLSIAVVGLMVFMPANVSAQATIPDQPVYFTFSTPVALPGTTLPAGEYEFRQSGTRVDREIIAVYDRRTGNRVTTVMAMPAALADGQPVPEEPTVRFYETAANTPPAVRSWWYPGIHGGGHEFIYPHDQATELARMNADGVLSTAGPEDSAAVTRVRASDAAGVAERAEPAQPRAEAAERADVERPAPAVARDAAERDMAMNRQDDADMASPRTALPRTATERGWFAAVGFLSVIAGLVLMGRRRAV